MSWVYAAVGAIRARPWILAGIFVLASAALAYKVVRSLPRSAEWAAGPAYTRVDYWIASSECAARTGKLLAYCNADGSVSAIESVNVADDPGHALLSGLYALAKGKAIGRDALAAANFSLNATALFCVSLTLFCFGWRGAALLILLWARTQAVPGSVTGPDSPAAFIAAFGFALTAVLLTAFAPLDGSRKTLGRFYVVLVLATAAIAISVLLRQPYGLGGLLASAAVLALRVFAIGGQIPRPSLHGPVVRAASTVGCLFVAVFFCAQAVVAVRDAVYGIPSSTQRLQHGISHNLYMGLGVAGNPWGIKWDDVEANKAANTVGEARYASKEHYANLWRLYLGIVEKAPLTVLHIYQAKLWDAFLVASEDDESRFARGAAAFLVLVGLLLYLRRGRSPEELCLVAGVWVLFGTILLQGVLAQPWRHFISPAHVAALCGFAVLMEALARQLLRARATR
jgi:hypothetical protein